MPGIEVPMVQELVPGRDRPVYHLCGYLSGAEDSALLAHRKLLQVPRRFGSGIAFETAEADAMLGERLLAMLRQIGFHGMFEAEFVTRAGEHLLIDLNVRPYNGMRLEAERGLHLAWYAYLEATGDVERLARELAAAREAPARDLAYCRRIEFAGVVAGQFIGGGFGLGDMRRWVRWYWRNRNQMVDPWVVPGDRRPGRARLRDELGRWRRSPKTYLGAYVRPESRW
jgi:hypothetical protein